MSCFVRISLKLQRLNQERNEFMERLTGRALTFVGSCTVLYELAALSDKDCDEYCNETFCGECVIQKAVNRLAAYENTGLEPQEIEAREEKIRRILIERLKELDQTLEEIPAGFDKYNTAMAKEELIEIYSRIFGITYDDAAKELRDHAEAAERLLG